MQTTGNGDLADEKKRSRPQESQQNSTVGAMAAATAALPRANAFPQPPVGAFDLYGPSFPEWNNQMINLQNWNEMMR